MKISKVNKAESSSVKKQKDSYKIKAVLKNYPSQRALWYVVTLPVSVGAKIYDTYNAVHGGFGSLKVEVGLGGSLWRTSIFRDSSAKSYILFIKSSIRKKESLQVGDTLSLTLVIE